VFAQSSSGSCDASGDDCAGHDRGRGAQERPGNEKGRDSVHNNGCMYAPLHEKGNIYIYIYVCLFICLNTYLYVLNENRRCNVHKTIGARASPCTNAGTPVCASP